MNGYTTFAICVVALCALLGFLGNAASKQQRAPAKTETLTCVRVKEITPAGTSNYLCEVKNAKPQ